ncbi:MAG: hypothetical protein C0490_04330, partial [Marivirga sp.]|nr:hypothetical protein [Marivirga sp.]
HGFRGAFPLLNISLIQCFVFKEYGIKKEKGYNQKDSNGNTVWKDVFREIYFFHAAEIEIKRKIGRNR